MTPSARRRRAAALALALAANLAACPGRLENPELFVGSNLDSGVQSCTIGVSAVEGTIVRPRCATANCHDRGQRAAGLDLESPNIAARVLNAPSTTCSGQVLVTAGGGGFFVDKLGRSPRCGDRMPLGSPPLTASEVSCVRAWLASLRIDAGVAPDVPRDVAMDVQMRDTVVADTMPNDARTDDAARDVQPTDATDDVRPMDAETFDAPADADAGDAPDESVDVDDAATDSPMDAALPDREPRDDAASDGTTPDDTGARDGASRDATGG